MSGFAQNINRVNHVVIVVHQENLEDAVKSFSELLAIEFEGPLDSQSGGLLVYINCDAGLELVAPYDPQLAKRHFEHLEKHGEGLMTVAFGIADRAAAVARAEKLGYEVWRWADGFTVNPAWKERFEVFDEAALTPMLHGTRVKFCELAPKKGA